MIEKRVRISFGPKGVFSQESLDNWKNSIDEELVKRMMRFRGVNDIRKDLSYKVLNSFDDPTIINEVIDLASKIKAKVPSGRFQYESIKSIVTRTQIDTLVDKLIHCKEEVRTSFDKMYETIDEQINLKIKEFDKLQDKGSKESVLEKLNLIREEKKQEIWRHIANQVLKQIKNGRYKINESFKGHRSMSAYGQIKARNKIFKTLASKKIWSGLENDIKSQIEDIQQLLEKNIKEVERENNER